ncbi:MAG: hypothetical protein AAF688_00755 [Bacteroidota bacterium]
MRKIVYLFAFLIIFFSCDNTESPGGNGNGADDPVPVLLVFPQKDILCNEGLDPTPTQSTVFFEWLPNSNAISYTLYLENLNTNEIAQYETDDNDFILPITIARATPYRWRVDYNLNGDIKQSEAWNFYNAGPGLQNYAPFPAEIASPVMAESLPTTTSVNLQWSGSDVDNDVVAYDVYFGTENPPTLKTSGLTETQLSVPVNPDTIYYWNIITKDAGGNTSESGVFQFRVL